MRCTIRRSAGLPDAGQPCQADPGSARLRRAQAMGQCAGPDRGGRSARHPPPARRYLLGIAAIGQVAGQKAEESAGRTLERYRSLIRRSSAARCCAWRWPIRWPMTSASLDRLRQHFAPKMQNTPDGSAFAVLSQQIDMHGLAFRDAAAKIASVDTLQAFMKDFGKRQAWLIDFPLWPSHAQALLRQLPAGFAKGRSSELDLEATPARGRRLSPSPVRRPANGSCRAAFRKSHDPRKALAVRSTVPGGLMRSAAPARNNSGQATLRDIHFAGAAHVQTPMQQLESGAAGFRHEVPEHSSRSSLANRSSEWAAAMAKLGSRIVLQNPTRNISPCAAPISNKVEGGTPQGAEGASKIGGGDLAVAPPASAPEARPWNGRPGSAAHPARQPMLSRSAA